MGGKTAEKQDHCIKQRILGWHVLQLFIVVIDVMLPSPSSPHLTMSVGRAFPWVLTKALPHAQPACSLTAACKTHPTSAQGTTCWKGKRLQN